MTWSAFDGEAIELIQEKTGTHLWVHCPAALRACLAAEPRVGVTILTRPVMRGKKGASPDHVPWKIDYFRHAMAQAIREGRISRRSHPWASCDSRHPPRRSWL